MPDPIARPAFNYGSLDTETAQFLNQQASAIKVLVKQSIENIIEVGKRLNEVKGLLAHGQWMNWLDAEFGWTERTALNYMRVAQEFKIENISNLQIANTALYVLAQPSTSDEAREEAVTRAQAGERITVSAARELRDRYITPSPKPDLESGLNSQEVLPDPVAQEPQSAPQIPLSSEPVSQPLPPIEPKAASPSPAKRKRAREQRFLRVVPKQVQPGDWWKLGQDNYLYCGDPASEDFQRRLPKMIALLLLSPPTREAWPQSLPSNATSVVADFTPYEEEQDLKLVRETIANHIQNKTDSGDTVVLSFLPDPAIVSLVEQLGCLFFCADPDPKRCDAALTVWTTTGRSAEKMKTRQTGKKRLSSPALAK